MFLKQKWQIRIIVTRINVVVEVIEVEEEIEVAEEIGEEVNREVSKGVEEAEVIWNTSKEESKNTKKIRMKLNNFWTTNKGTSSTFYSTKTSLVNKR